MWKAIAISIWMQIFSLVLWVLECDVSSPRSVCTYVLSLSIFNTWSLWHLIFSLFPSHLAHIWLHMCDRVCISVNNESSITFPSVAGFFYCEFGYIQGSRSADASWNYASFLPFFWCFIVGLAAGVWESLVLCACVARSYGGQHCMRRPIGLSHAWLWYGQQYLALEPGPRDHRECSAEAWWVQVAAEWVAEAAQSAAPFAQSQSAAAVSQHLGHPGRVLLWATIGVFAKRLPLLLDLELHQVCSNAVFRSFCGV